MSIVDVIKKRTSIRKYHRLSIDRELVSIVEEIIAKDIATPFGNKPRFRLINRTDLLREEQVKVGTYGFISGAEYFIVGAIQQKEFAFEDYGYALEDIILQLTKLNLGTCWLGGTFNRSEFGKAIELKENEIIPSITPLGIPAERRGVREKLIRILAKSHSRKKFDDLFFKTKQGSPITVSTNCYLTALEMIRIAPSAENAQPWRVIQGVGDNYHFFLHRKKAMLKLMGGIDLQKVDMGIALCHFEKTVRELGGIGSWKYTNDKPQSEDEYVVSWINR